MALNLNAKQAAIGGVIWGTSPSDLPGVNVVEDDLSKGSFKKQHRALLRQGTADMLAGKLGMTEAEKRQKSGDQIATVGQQAAAAAGATARAALGSAAPVGEAFRLVADQSRGAAQGVAGAVRGVQAASEDQATRAREAILKGIEAEYGRERDNKRYAAEMGLEVAKTAQSMATPYLPTPSAVTDLPV